MLITLFYDEEELHELGVLPVRLYQRDEEVKELLRLHLLNQAEVPPEQHEYEVHLPQVQGCVPDDHGHDLSQHRQLVKVVVTAEELVDLQHNAYDLCYHLREFHLVVLHIILRVCQ